MAGIGDAPCRSMFAEDVRDLQRRTGQQCRGLRGWLDRRDELLEWAGDLAQRLEGDAGVTGRGVELGMAEQPRAIMRTLYVTETKGSVGWNPMVASAARACVRDTQPCPPP